MLLVGNKCDLEKQREVTYDEGLECARANGLRFVETTARDYKRAEEAFEMLAQSIFTKIEEGTIPLDAAVEL